MVEEMMVAAALVVFGIGLALFLGGCVADVFSRKARESSVSMGCAVFGVVLLLIGILLANGAERLVQ